MIKRGSVESTNLALSVLNSRWNPNADLHYLCGQLHNQYAGEKVILLSFSSVDDFEKCWCCMVQIGFSIFIVLWAICMLEFWKRKEKLTALSWGMIDFEKTEVTRPGRKSAAHDQVVSYCFM